MLFPPSELLAGGDAAVVEVAAVVGGVGLEDGEHDLGHPVPDGGRRLGFAVVGGAPEVVVLGDGRIVLQEPVQVVAAVFEVVLPARNTVSTGPVSLMALQFARACRDPNV
jgi:hypothetical protein